MDSINLEAVGITKIYPGTMAVNNVSVAFKAGEVHALIGKNGAGKSTLVKILSGAVTPSSGRILVQGKEVVIRSPKEAFANGIATVYQELSLMPELTVGENILLGRLPMKRIGIPVIHWDEVFKQAQAVLDSLHVDIDVRAKVSSLRVAQQQVVEIAKAMSYNPSVLMLDEPTSALSHDETLALFDLIRKLAAKGAAIVYISHRLQELQEIVDVVTVLRDGRFVGTIPVSEATPRTLTEMMFGEHVQGTRPPLPEIHHIPVLEVKGLTRAGRFSDVSFTLNKGEILGIAGMLGSGRTELLRAIAGSDPFDGGEIVVGEKSIQRTNPGAMKKLGVCLTPENRKEEGLVQLLSTSDNVCMASLDKISLKGFIWRGRQRPIVEKSISDLQIAVHDPDEPVSSLSGGNQQKVIVGNWLNIGPRIILLDEPTRGIDVQAKQQIFQIARELSAQGISSIFVSSELEELLEVCHRLLIMQKGRIVKDTSPEQLSIEDLFELCMEEVK